MLGLVFTEFMEMVETEFSLDMVDELIEDNDLATEGAYTSVGKYEVSELVALVVSLSEKSSIAVPDLLEAFGKHLMSRFVSRYPIFFEEVDNSFSFLKKVHDHIHQEVKKLYNNADLPSVIASDEGEDRLVVDYSSRRALGDVALGLIKGVAGHYQENLRIERLQLPPNDGTRERFILTRL